MKNKEEERFRGLSNEELLIIYYRFKSKFESLEKDLAKNKMSVAQQSTEGINVEKMDIDDNSIKELRNSIYYKTVKSLLGKLEPITKIIEDCDDSIKELLQSLK